ncbi:MFS transporter [Allokutzneria oryzae]|uniref:MFS transporter n=1 Tax=Allokutzneria oryzae TaxID=1378989 RepID=A0ABV5ZRA6_9PSEU
MRNTGTSPRRVLVVTTLCVVLVVGMVAAINLALPQLAASPLRPSRTELVWIVDGYLLAFACLLIPGGALGDRYGRRRVLATGLAVFAAGSAVAGITSDVSTLLAARAVSGTGAAMVLPNTLALIVAVVPRDKRKAAVATWASATGIGGIVGNLGGGLLVELTSWRGLFAAVAPLALLALAATLLWTPRTPTSDTPIDLPGTALLVLGFGALLFGIIEAPELGWGSATVVVAFGTAAALLALFVLVELRRSRPLLDPRVFRSPMLRAGTTGIAVVFFGMFALFFVNGQYLQYVHGFGPMGSGAGVLPMAVAMVAGVKGSARLGRRIGERGLVATGLLLVGSGLALLSLSGTETPYWVYALLLVVTGFGVGLANPTLSGDVVAALPARQSGVASGLSGTARELGSALGVAVLATVMSGAGGAFPDAMGAGLRVVAAMVLVAGVPVVCWRPGVPIKTRTGDDGAHMHTTSLAESP